MSRLNAEGHDESQYLPRDCPPVNAFRERQGGVIYEGTAIKALSWLPDILFDKQRITKPHLDTSNSFFRILVNAKRTLGICDLRGTLFEKFPNGISSDTDAFLEIIRGISRPESNILIWLVWDDYNRKNVPLALHVMGTIHHALENAQNVIDMIAKKRDNASSTSPESCPNLHRSGSS